MKKIGTYKIKQKLQGLSLLFFAGFFALIFLPRLFITNAEKDPIIINDTKETENRLPEIMDLHHKEIGLGQRWFFGVEVIDEEGDLVRVELVEKPNSAKFNQNTLTVDWTPQTSDGKNGKFVVKVTETPRDKSREPRTVTKEFQHQSRQKSGQLHELPPTSLEVDAFVSVIDPARLKAASKSGISQIFFSALPRSKPTNRSNREADIQTTDGKRAVPRFAERTGDNAQKSDDRSRQSAV